MSSHTTGRSTATLFDQSGKTVRAWRLPPGEPAWAIELLGDGGLIAVESHRGLLRLTASAAVRWRVAGEYHHVAEVQGDRIVTLRRRARRGSAVHPAAAVLDDEVVTFDLDGRELESFSLTDTILASPFRFLLPALSDAELLARSAGRPTDKTELDVLHSNHAERLDAAAAAALKSGEGAAWLVSIRNLNAVALIGSERHDVRWIWGPGRLALQHHPTLTAPGRLLVFNNLGTSGSEVIELDVLSRRTVWRYAADDFFSRWGGSCQRLSNGNTLITDSDSGWAFEVTPDGRRVWEWRNPDVENGIRQPVYRATRYAPDAVELAFFRSPS